VLAWYVTIASFGSGIGSEVSGRLVHYLQRRPGWTDVDAYHALFWIYLVMGIVNVLFVLLLTDACELKSDGKGEGLYAQVPQEDERAGEEQDPSRPSDAPAADVESLSPPPTPRTPRIPPPPSPPPGKAPSRFSKATATFTRAFSEISSRTLNTMYKLWFLLLIDSLADGMVPYSLTNYYMDVKFHPTKATLGDVTSLSYVLSGIGAVFAGPLARKIGLINTMVFTHVPSSTAVLLFPLAPRFWLTALLLLVRAGLNNMDQAPRSAFIAAVVLPSERTAVMGITSMLRTLAAMCGPTVTGWLAEGDRFGWAFYAAGVCRLGYDFGLWALFVGYERGGKLVDRQDGDAAEQEDERSPGQGDWELDSLVDEDDGDSLASEDIRAGGKKRRMDEKDELQNGEITAAVAVSNGDLNRRPSHHSALQLQLPQTGTERVRSRSPHRMDTD
jgi:hypothetical protein